MRKLNLFLKRFFDIFCSFFGLLLLSPLIVALIAAIRLDSPGKAIFVQERVGRNQRVFKVRKFRTMIINAEHIGDGLLVRSESDSRITRVGGFLRKTSLDELPQLWNVLVGEMSLVGPRPPVTYYPYKVGEYDEHKSVRFEMRPGITGLVQSTVRNSVSWDERIEIDIDYIKRFNIFLDLKILFGTLFKIFRSESIYGEHKDLGTNEKELAENVEK